MDFERKIILGEHFVM